MWAQPRCSPRAVDYPDSGRLGYAADGPEVELIAHGPGGCLGQLGFVGIRLIPEIQAGDDPAIRAADDGGKRKDERIYPTARDSSTGSMPLSLRMALAIALNSFSMTSTDCQRASGSICLVHTPSLSVRSVQPARVSIARHFSSGWPW